MTLLAVALGLVAEVHAGEPVVNAPAPAGQIGTIDPVLGELGAVARGVRAALVASGLDWTIYMDMVPPPGAVLPEPGTAPVGPPREGPEPPRGAPRVPRKAEAESREAESRR